MYSLNCPETHQLEKKKQWDSDRLAHTDQWFQSTTLLQPGGLKADHAFKLSDCVYFTSV